MALVRVLVARMGLKDSARQWLGLWPPEPAPSLAAGLATAIISMLVLVGLWPLVREIGLAASLFAWQPIARYTYTWADAGRRHV